MYSDPGFSTLTLKSRLPVWWRLVRGDRPVGTLLLLWPTWWALWLAAEGLPPLSTLAIFTAGVWLTRSAGCVINDYADRWLDPHVERTKSRPLATGEASPREALALFAAMMGVAFALVLLTNRLTVYLSVIAVILAASYPFLKRWTYLPQVYLGLAFGWGIPMAFAAVRGEVPAIAWLLFLGNLLWTTGYDTWYAMVDREDDLKIGAKSTAILFGDADLIAQGVLFGGFLLTMGLLAGRADLGIYYWLALGIAAVLVLRQFWIARGRGRAECFEAFLSNQWVGMAVFAGFAAHYAL
ncbi:4-hydroxybenzoate octaprenyltransferase [Arenimonas composti]|uniref:4-hydroxybenzoate octaprenyltransferase n=1 Tax=Arenimonas composti TR7-09 = DSM 18010 TaxID=1121013 RepID=A0A091BWG6_9GAMM|nr:4-hydroxybenzoate octaprenyltransferase [Arenimonas composti]KFN48690.1 hypothetical protein P873_13615 [Arenimonas composti TR7-09 = DSM 18010]